MEAYVILLVSLSSLIVGITIGYYAGKYSERIAWNRLIERGILPKPKNGRKREMDFYEGEDF